MVGEGKTGEVIAKFADNRSPSRLCRGLPPGSPKQETAGFLRWGLPAASPYKAHSKAFVN
jgi:hypothetical protein